MPSHSGWFPEQQTLCQPDDTSAAQSLAPHSSFRSDGQLEITRDIIRKRPVRYRRDGK